MLWVTAADQSKTTCFCVILRSLRDVKLQSESLEGKKGGFRAKVTTHLLSPRCFHLTELRLLHHISFIWFCFSFFSVYFSTSAVPTSVFFNGAWTRLRANLNITWISSVMSLCLPWCCWGSLPGEADCFGPWVTHQHTSTHKTHTHTHIWEGNSTIGSFGFSLLFRMSGGHDLKKQTRILVRSMLAWPAACCY